MIRVAGYRLWRWSSTLVLAALLLAPGARSLAQNATPVASPYVPGTDLSQLSGRIIADGSSTVWPIMVAAGEQFTELAPNVVTEIEFSGTTGGFRRFCAGDSDLQDASRPIMSDEDATCATNGVKYDVYPLGFDGITITVNPQNTWVTCLTVDQLHALWQPDATIHSWKDLDPSWPDAKIELYAPGPDSGTFDYFTEMINGEVDASRTDYIPSENDLDLVEGVASQKDALGYFGFAYYEQNADRLRPVAVDAGKGCIAPSAQTIADGTYAPLSRLLYVYVNLADLSRPEVQEFLHFALSQAPQIVSTVGYVPLPAADYAKNQEQLKRTLAAIG